jgi:putative endonuclease
LNGRTIIAGRGKERVVKGRASENLVAEKLAADGWLIVARNWRKGRGELDIVASKNGTMAFVEVKTVDAYGRESLASSVGPLKRLRIIETSKLFVLLHREFKCAAIRFDVASVEAGVLADYFENAFAERT